MNIKNPIYDTTIRLILLLIVVVWCMLLIYPFISVILWSVVFALTLSPLHKKLALKIGNRPKVASGILIVGILVLLIIPLAFIATSMIEEVKEIKTSYESGTLTIPAPPERLSSIPVVGPKAYAGWKSASENLEGFMQVHQEQLLEMARNGAKGILSAISGLMQIILSLVIAGVLLVLGGISESVRNVFRKVAGEHGDNFANITVQTVNSVVKGILGESLIMAILLGFVIMLDSVLTPIMLGKGAPVPTLVIFIGTIGGFILSGFIGLFTGAIVMSIGYSLFTQWVKPDEIPQEQIN